MTTSRVTDRPYLILTQDDYRVLGPDDFGGPGLRAIESIGPFVDIQASGPLITVHDSVIEPHLGIGHHPHRYNERLFYIMSGQLDHDDALNGIRGHVETGDAALFTEGRRGMVHSEWNHGDAETHAYILVYSCDPVPTDAEFSVLKDSDAPRYEEGAGVRTKELVGPRSSLRVHGDLRLMADTSLEGDGIFTFITGAQEGGLLAIQEGHVRLDDQDVGQGMTVVFPPAEAQRTFKVAAVGPARVIRAVYGPGHGLVRRSETGR